MGIIDFFSGDDDHSRVLQTPDPVGKNFGQAFRMGGVAADIGSAKFRMVAIAVMEGDSITLAAKIYACTGTPGTDGMQTGEALATSTPIEYTESSDPFQPDWAEFTFSTPYTLEANTNYCLVLECTALTEVATAQGIVTSDDTSPTHDGNECYYDGSPGYNADEDTNFYAYSAVIGWSAKINGVSPGKVNGVAVANIGKITGV